MKLVWHSHRWVIADFLTTVFICNFGKPITGLHVITEIPFSFGHHSQQIKLNQPFKRKKLRLEDHIQADECNSWNWLCPMAIWDILPLNKKSPFIWLCSLAPQLVPNTWITFCLSWAISCLHYFVLAMSGMGRALNVMHLRSGIFGDDRVLKRVIVTSH